MKLSSIWTLKGFPLKERLIRTRNWIDQQVAHMLPPSVRYWVFIQMAAKATMNSKNVPATPIFEVLDNLETPKNLR